ncbi:Sh3beta [Carabus blaptoides fortunei]
MGVKVYISGISGNKEVKKRQQRVLMILDSRNIKYSVVDITEPGRESDRDYMQEKSTALGVTVSDTNPRHPLPPQIFNEKEYCGDYDQFDLSNENDELDKFLKLAPSDEVKVSNAEITLGNGNVEREIDSSEPVEADSAETPTVTADSTELEVDSTEKEAEVESTPDDADENEEPKDEESSKLPEEVADDAA